MSMAGQKVKNRFYMYRSCSESHLWYWEIFRKRVVSVHGRKSTKESYRKLEQILDAAFKIIFIITKCFQKSKQKLYIQKCLLSMAGQKVKNRFYMCRKYWFNFKCLQTKYSSSDTFPSEGHDTEYGVPGFLSSRPNWFPPPQHPQGSLDFLHCYKQKTNCFVSRLYLSYGYHGPYITVLFAFEWIVFRLNDLRCSQTTTAMLWTFRLANPFDFD